MRITCPFCGDRDHAEFSYEGDATVDWPDLDSEDVDAWQRAVFQRRNPAGRHREFWHHVHGCRIWLEIERDTVTHEIFNVRIAHPPTAKALDEERRTSADASARPAHSDSAGESTVLPREEGR